MKFIKKTLFSNQSHANISILFSQQNKKEDSKIKNAQISLQNQYKSIKESLGNLQLVASQEIYISLLQNFLFYKKDENNKKVDKLISSFNFNKSKKQKEIPLLNTFSYLSSLQKYKFLIDTIKCIRQKRNQLLLQKKQEICLNVYQSSLSLKPINFKQHRLQISSEASISLNQFNSMSLSYWTKVHFQLNIKKKIITATGKQSFIAELQNYLIRLSKKQKFCFVLQCCNPQKVSSWLRKIYIHLKKDIFVQIYYLIWNIVVKTQFDKMTSQIQDVKKQKQLSSPSKSNKSDQFSDQQEDFQIEQSKYFIFLTPVMLKNFYNYKSKIVDKIRKKMQFIEYKEIEFNSANETQGLKNKLQKITFLRINQQKNIQLFKLKAIISIPASVLKFKFLDSFKQHNKFISSWQILQKQNSLNLQTVAQAFDFNQIMQDYQIQDKSKVKFKQLTLKQQIIDYANDQLTQILFLKAVKQLSKQSFLNFLIAQCYQIKNEKSELVITCELNKNMFKEMLKKAGKKQQNLLSKQKINEIKRKIGEQFLKQMVMMIFSKEKLYQQKQIRDQLQFFTICESFNSETDEMGFSQRSIKLKEEEFLEEKEENFNQQTQIKKITFKKMSSLQQYRNKQKQLKQQEVKESQSTLKKHQSFKDNARQTSINLIQIKRSLDISEKSSYLNHKYEFAPQEKNSKPALVKKNLLSQEWKRIDQGGLMCISEAKIKEQKLILKKVIAKMGQNIIKQKSIMHVSLPVTIFKKQSQLTTIARALTYAPLLLQPQYFRKNKDQIDKIQRLKKLIVFLVSNNYSQINFQKPFNPILGETLQLWIDGCPVYFEQISHHPQITYFYFIGRGFKTYGAIQPKISMGMNHFKIFSWCIKRIQFEDGSHIQTGPNRMIVNGAIFGQRTFNVDEKNFVYDMTNNLMSIIQYGPIKKGLFSSSAEPLDHLSGRIMKMTDEFRDRQYYKWKQRLDYVIKKQWIEEQVSCYEGIWNKKIYFDGVEYFDFDKELPYEIIEQQYALASDSRYREDLKWLIKGNLQKSQELKQIMEDKQRADKKLRSKHKK